MRVLLVRHASAGDRNAWDGDDDRRPLDERGHKQASGLVDLLLPFVPKGILSSGSLRCRETVEPLAEALALDVQERGELAEGSRRDDVVRLAAGFLEEPVVLCTHGDVVEALLGHEGEKGSTWLIRIEGDAVEPLEYLAAAG
jgi:broad specificity phosphatase PhoE